MSIRSIVPNRIVTNYKSSDGWFVSLGVLFFRSLRGFTLVIILDWEKRFMEFFVMYLTTFSLLIFIIKYKVINI